MLQKIKAWLYRFMYGRNGVDSISKALFIPIIAIILISSFVQNTTVKTVLSLVNYGLLIYMYFRIFSKNVSKRRAESAWLDSKLRYYKTRAKQSKDYRFFDCPECGTHLRVPRGVGKITITCKKCGKKFDRKA